MAQCPRIHQVGKPPTAIVQCKLEEGHWGLHFFSIEWRDYRDGRNDEGQKVLS